MKGTDGSVCPELGIIMGAGTYAVKMGMGGIFSLMANS